MSEEHEIDETEGGLSNAMHLWIFVGLILGVGLLFFGAVTAVMISKNDKAKAKNATYAVYPYTGSPTYAVKAASGTAPYAAMKATSPPTTVPATIPVNTGPIVTSKPPLAVPGTQFQYQMVVKSPIAHLGLEYIFLSGPRGMTVSRSGLVTWQVNEDYKGTETGSVSVVDKSGRFHYHTFPLAIR